MEADQKPLSFETKSKSTQEWGNIESGIFSAASCYLLEVKEMFHYVHTYIYIYTQKVPGVYFARALIEIPNFALMSKLCT